MPLQEGIPVCIAMIDVYVYYVCMLVFCVSATHCEDLDLFALACKLVIDWMANLKGGNAVELPHLVGRDIQGINMLWFILITQKPLHSC